MIETCAKTAACSNAVAGTPPGLVSVLKENSELICEIGARVQNIRALLHGGTTGENPYPKSECALEEMMLQGGLLRDINKQLTDLMERLH